MATIYILYSYDHHKLYYVTMTMLLVQETFFKAVQQAIIIDHDEEELEYDSDGNPVIPDHAKVVIVVLM